MTLTTGQMLQNRYRVASPLGQGGMGAVYRAWDTRLNVPVALKEMVPQTGLDPYTLAQLRQQFQQEATILARLDHPHLVRVTDFFEEAGNAYLVMNFVEGENLAERIEREGAQPEGHMLEWAGQLLDALGYCHSQGVIHRDVKPQNVIIRSGGRAVLVDFGLVKLWDPHDPRTKTAMRGMGTPEYAPPEQYDVGLGHTDPRSDVYSLGATLYHALTGQAPPTATQRIASRSAFRPPRGLNQRISPATETAVLRAMELTVEDRFPTAQAMATALGLGSRQPAPPAPPVRPKRERTKKLSEPQPPAPVQRKRVPVWAWAVGGLAVLALVVVAVFGVKALVTSGRGGKQDVYRPTGEGQVTRTPGRIETWSLVPASGGTTLFTSDRDGKREIYRMTGTGEVVRVTHTPGSRESWAPVPESGGAILFTSDRDGKREIHRMTGTGEVVRVTHTPGRGGSWAPVRESGGAILFTSDRDGKRELYRMTGMGEVMRVTHTPGSRESWAPVPEPGGAILFTSDRDGKRELYRLTGTGEVVRVTHTPGSRESWSPVPEPGGAILFTSDRDGKQELYRLTGTGEIVRITNTPGRGESWLADW